MIALNAIEPRNCALINTTTVSIAQLSCGNRKTCVQNKASKPARPILIPYRTLKPPKKSWRVHCHFVAIKTAREAIITVGRESAAWLFREFRTRVQSRQKRSDQSATAPGYSPKPER